MLFEKKVALVGFPGIGSVGKIALDYLITSLDANKIMTVPFSGFPPQVVVEGGLVRLFMLETFAPPGREDILLLTSDAQPLEVLGMNTLAGEILGDVKGMGVKDVVTLAAYVGAVQNPVVGTSSEREGVEFLKRAGIAIMPTGIIGGLNGLIAGMAPLYGLRGFCLLGTTSGDKLVDLRAARNLLMALKDLLQIEIDVEDLEIEEEEEEAPPVTEVEEPVDEEMIYR